MLEPGQCIGPYVVTEQIGRGGQAVVWAGTHTHTEEHVAIKVLTTVSEESRTRFVNEARAQTALDSPHVVQIKELLRVGPQPAIVMERVRGPTLTRLLREHAPSPVQLDALVNGICEGVMAAHQAGLIHRDIKPSNVLIDSQGGAWLPKLTDFGIAKQVAQTEDMSEITGTGIVLGTPGFMAPEQCRGWTDLDARVDVFAVGCLLYLLATGRRPFQGTSRLMVMIATCQGNYAPLSTLAPELPRHQVLAIQSALQVDRTGRAQHVDTLRELWFDRVPAKVALAIAKRMDPTEHPPELQPADESDHFRTEAAAPPLPEGDGVLIGRDRDVRALTEELQRHPLVTVVGLGGAGKTRLALAAAHKLKESENIQVHLADMTHADSMNAVVSALASGLGIRLTRKDPEAQLLEALTLRTQTLLLIDNAETAHQWLRELLEKWTAAETATRFLLTSRMPMQVAGEQTFRLSPLPPGAGMELFKHRARRMGAPSAALDVWNPIIEEIVRRVDGLPLAIELAAARTTELSPGQILDGLGERFELLQSTLTTGSGRHQGLRSMLEEMWAQLPPWTQLTLAQCSVFRGGFGIRAAEAVIDLRAWPEAPDAMDVLHSLMDHSLLIARRSKMSGARIHMLDTIQEFAALKMGENGAVSAPGGATQTGTEPLQAVKRRHATHFRRYGTVAYGKALRTFHGQRKRTDMLRERENILAAAPVAIGLEDTKLAVDCLVGLGRIYMWVGPYSAGLSQLMALEEDLRLPAEEAMRLTFLGCRLAWFSGNIERAIPFTVRSAALAAELGDRIREGTALAEKAYFFWMRNQRDAARTQAAEARQLLDTDDPETATANHLFSLATTVGIMEGARAKQSLLEHAVRRARQEGDALMEGRLLGTLAQFEMQDGRLDRARALLADALKIARTHKSLEREAMTSSNIAILDMMQGNSEAALQSNARAIALHQHVGAARNHALEHGNRGEILAEMGRLDEAVKHLQLAIDNPAMGPARWAFKGTLAFVGALGGAQEEALLQLTECISQLETASPWEAAKLVCKRGHVLLKTSDLEAASAALQDAEQRAAALSAAPGSDLGLALANLREAVTSA